VSEQLHLAVALDGYGWHPEAWRHTPELEPVTSGRYWSGLAATAERGLLDFVTSDDALTPQRRRRPEIEPRWLAGRPDAVMVASRVAPVTNHIALIPVATVTHTEPFHVSKAIATLDFVSGGRAGWQVRVSGTPHEADLFGRRDVRGADLFDQGPMRSRWSAGSGTAGRTMPSSATSPPAGSSTGTNCTTSTSRASTSR